MRVLACCVVALVSAAVVPVSASISECGSEVRSVEGRPLDLAPPKGFVDICVEDQALCKSLTSAYPASMHPIGYFVPKDEWVNKTKPPDGFRRYLMALLVTTKTPESLPGVRAGLRGVIAAEPDKAKLEAILKDRGQASLGVIEDASDVFAFGAVGPRQSAGSPDALLAMTNSAMALKGRMLSLYVSATVTDLKQVDAVKALTTQWLGCLRTANK
ncbi:MAG: hypothetical protein ABI629_26800 [bacterium]